MLLQASLSSKEPSCHLQVEADRYILSQDGGSRETWLRFRSRLVVLALIGVSACVLVSAASQSGPAEPHSAASFSIAPASSRIASAPQPLLGRAQVVLRNGGASKSRFGDDGTREPGVSIGDGISEKILSSPFAGLFEGFKFGTEVEVVAQEETAPKKETRKVSGGMAGINSYRNTESARLGSEKGQQTRKAKLDAYINSEAPAADKTFGKIIAGSLILTIIALLGGVVAYYGIDGLNYATTVAPNRSV